MPTYARKHQLQDSIVYHIMNRGISKQQLFYDRQDFNQFISILKRYKKRFNFKLYHWVLMPNHYHLLMEMDNPKIMPSLMSGINRSYTSYYHKIHKTCGYLWQGRYKSQPIQKERYLMNCSRYIERNPVAAKIAAAAHHYRYSSARYYLDGIDDELTSKHSLFISLGPTENLRRNIYLDWLKNSNNARLNQDFENLSKPVGDKKFLKKLILDKGVMIPRRRGRLPGFN